MQYRADIDGLRAVAVLLVLFFHLDVRYFSAGWLGVDVFFILSGFLITSIIAPQIGHDNFSFKDFYARRIRRLFPALFTTVFLTFMAAAFLLIPADFQALSKSALGAVFSVSNMIFWSEAGYWDQVSHLKPLLHTWSLSVEEQFYLLWPALIFLCGGTKSRKTFFALAVFGLISFFLGIAFRAHTSSVFYIFIFRIFEFAAGGVLGLYMLSGQPSISDKFKPFIFWLSAAALMVLVFSNPSFKTFLGLPAVLLCVAVCGLLFAGNDGLATRVLGSPPLTWLGKRSYSIYLTHWPLIVLYQQIDPTALNGQKWVFLFMASVLTGWALYACVESRFRYTSHSRPKTAKLSPPRFGLILGGFFLVTSAAYAHSYSSGGWTWRYTANPMYQYAHMTVEKVNEIRARAIVRTCPQLNFIEITIEGKCFEKASTSDVIIMGNSHAEDTLNIWNEMFPADKIAFLGGAGCPPIYPIQEFGSPDCMGINKRRFEAIEQIPADWDGIFVFGGKTDRRNVKGHRDAMLHIKKLGHKILILGNTPVFKQEVHAQVMKAGDVDIAEQELNEKHTLKLATDGIFRNFAKKHGFAFVSKRKALCPRANYCRIHDDGKLFYFDSNHLTVDGSKYLAKKLKPAVLKARKALGR